MPGLAAAAHSLADDYARDGFVGGVPVLSSDQAAGHRARFERAETEFGKPLHYVSKVHTILTSPLELATAPAVLDAVEALIGPDILLLDVTYIVKEPKAASFVSWHQDLTYWGLDGGDQVSMWLALSPATAESGCMRVIPGSHVLGRIDLRLEKQGDIVSRQAVFDSLCAGCIQHYLFPRQILDRFVVIRFPGCNRLHERKTFVDGAEQLVRCRPARSDGGSKERYRESGQGNRFQHCRRLSQVTARGKSLVVVYFFSTERLISVITPNATAAMIFNSPLSSACSRVRLPRKKPGLGSVTAPRVTPARSAS